ncbi:MAG: membrane protein insertion efficiency factor YidD, partial [Eubacterium sp.]|nr:membrane protein insertion efficiency factor YidD [Eubacterium sp.]
TCSHYAIEAIEIHGIFKGALLAIWRILRCNPFCKGGWDPVPPKKSKEDN